MNITEKQCNILQYILGLDEYNNYYSINREADVWDGRMTLETKDLLNTAKRMNDRDLEICLISKMI